MRRVALAVALAAALGGCKKKESKPAEAGRPAVKEMSPGEAEFGRKACEAYVAQVCACAPRVPAVQPDCDVAKARPEALEMNLRAALAPGNATSTDREALLTNTRQIIRDCVEAGSELVKKGCPPAPPPGAPTAPAAPSPSTPPEPGPAR
jgi:hypothetical protein